MLETVEHLVVLDPAMEELAVEAPGQVKEGPEREADLEMGELPVEAPGQAKEMMEVKDQPAFQTRHNSPSSGCCRNRKWMPPPILPDNGSDPKIFDRKILSQDLPDPRSQSPCYFEPAPNHTLHQSASGTAMC